MFIVYFPSGCAREQLVLLMIPMPNTSLQMHVCSSLPFFSQHRQASMSRDKIMLVHRSNPCLTHCYRPRSIAELLVVSGGLQNPYIDKTNCMANLLRRHTASLRTTHSPSGATKTPPQKRAIYASNGTSAHIFKSCSEVTTFPT